MATNFSLSTENFKEFNEALFFKNFFLLLRQNNTPMMLLIGVKRGVNKLYSEAGDGIGTVDLNKLENILIKFPKNKFLVSCLDLKDQFRLSVIARKFQNLKIVGFWWFNNNESVIENVFLDESIKTCFINFPEAFYHIYGKVLNPISEKDISTKAIVKYNKLLSQREDIKASDLEKKINIKFE